MTALREEVLRVRLLEVVASNFAARDLCRNRENRDAAAMAIVKAVDEVKISWTTAACAHGQLAGQMGFRTGGEGGSFFVSDMNPAEIVANSNGFGYAVERVAPARARTSTSSCAMFFDTIRILTNLWTREPTAAKARRSAEPFAVLQSYFSLFSLPL